MLLFDVFVLFRSSTALVGKSYITFGFHPAFSFPGEAFL